MKAFNNTTKNMTQTNRLLGLFKTLAEFDSPSFGETMICNFLKKKLQNLGFTVSEDDSAAKTGGTCGNIYAYLEGTHEKSELCPILFCSHMDTVEPSHGKKVIFHDDGKITSDQTTVLGADDCGGIASIIEALTVIKEHNLPHRPIEIIFSAAEEPYCAGMHEFDFDKIKSRQAYVLDLSGKVGQASNQAPTILAFSATFLGKAAHAGFSPEDGRHAIAAAALAVSQIPCGKFGETTVNIGTIQGGTANNIVPDYCKITGEIRSLSDHDADEKLKEITETILQAAKSFDVEAAISDDKKITAYLTDKNHEVSNRFIKVCRDQGLDGTLCTTYGGSDNNILAEHGISGLVVASAMNNCHSLTEYTSIEELKKSAELTLSLMLSQE